MIPQVWIFWNCHTLLNFTLSEKKNVPIKHCTHPLVEHGLLSYLKGFCYFMAPGPMALTLRPYGPWFLFQELCEVALFRVCKLIRIEGIVFPTSLFNFWIICQHLRFCFRFWILIKFENKANQFESCWRKR